MLAVAAAVSPASAIGTEAVNVSPQVRAEQQFRAELGFRSQLSYVQALQRVKDAARVRLAFGAVFTPAEQRELTARKQLANDATRLDGMLRQRYASNYGGMYIDQRAGGLLKIAFVHPDAGARTFALARLHAPQRLRFWTSRMTEQQLTALSAAITASMGELRALGVFITGVGADYAANLVDVGVDAKGAALDRATSVLQARFGNHGLSIHFQGPSREASCLGCDTDSLPFKAGQEVDDETSGGICTAGYGAHTLFPETWFQLTAGHCSVNGDVWAHFIYVIGTTSGDTEGGNADVQRLQLSAQSEHSSQVFVNGTYVQVSGQASSFTQGGTVCFFGRTTGFEKCGTITRTSYTDYSCGGVHGCTTVTDTVTASYLYQGGDSGGPNFQQASPTVAYGMSRSYCDQTCAGAGNPTFSTFTKIANELNAEGLYLNTTSNP
jgi:hypothetical protein